MKKIVTNADGLPTNVLFRLYAFFKNELSLRQYRNPVGDRACRLVAQYLSGELMKPSNKGFDLRMRDGGKVEVKARCMKCDGTRVLASDIRCLDQKLFDYLAMVIFHPDMTISLAVLIPYCVVAEQAKYSEHSNAWRFYFRGEVLTSPGVREITKELKAIEAEDASDAIQRYNLVVTA